MSVAWTEPIDWAVCRPDGQASSDKGHQAERPKQTAAAYARLEVPHVVDRFALERRSWASTSLSWIRHRVWL